MSDLEKLQQALSEYRKVYWIPWRRKTYKFKDGLCKYFKQTFDCDCLPDSLRRARKKEANEQYDIPLILGLPDCNSYWYTPGDLSPRINLLKKAIKREEQKTGI